MNAREAAYFALLTSLREEEYLAQSLLHWQQEEHPSLQDFAFAYEIASGSARMALALDYIAAHLTTRQKLNLKLQEKALLRTAIYQCCYMSKVPLYAIIDQTVNIAKRHCHRTFAAFLNAILRKLKDEVPSLPAGNTPKDLSIRYSYPLFFVKKILVEYGTKIAMEILERGNTTSKTMVRVRPGIDINAQAFQFLSPVKDVGLPIAIMDKAASLSAVAASPEVYIQNATSVCLVAELAERTTPPKRILDLCASPGGKLIAAHDLFPKAALFANDITEAKVERLRQNLKKYSIHAHLSCGPGEHYNAESSFDLIILDVPCSNSGVLNKRAEARWRLSEQKLTMLQQKQQLLIDRALKLLSPHGTIWYMTCSILKEENEDMAEEACRHHSLHMPYARKILPNKEGWDGGYASMLER